MPLSICIPTFNRAKYLHELLENISTISNKYKDYFEIVVSDNCSNDNTEDIVRKFQYANKDISCKYIKQASNIGPENNFYFVASQASNKYLIVLGDDDKISDNFFKALLKHEEEDIDMFILNFSVFNLDFSRCTKKETYSFKDDTLFTHKNKVLETFGPGPSFISSIILKKELFEKVEQTEYAIFNKYGFSFLFLVYLSISNKKNLKVMYLKDTLILQRSGNSSIADFDEQFFTGQCLVFEELMGYGYSQEAIKKAKNSTLTNYGIWRIKDIKFKGDSPVKLLEILVEKYKFHYYTWTILVPLLLVPQFVHRFLRLIKSKL